MKPIWICALALFRCVATQDHASADVIYDSHGFEGFQVGPINGQDGWTGWERDGGQGAVVLTGPPSIGEKSVRLENFNADGATSEMWRTFDDLLVQGYARLTVRFDIYTPSPHGGWFPVLWWFFENDGYPSAGAQWNEESPGVSHVYPFVDPFDPFTNDSWVNAKVDQWATLEIDFLLDEKIVLGVYDGVVVSQVDIANLPSLSLWDIELAQAGEDTNYFEDIWIDNFIITADKEDCYPDFTGDGVLDLFDFLAYVNTFNADDPAADCTGDGDLDLFDFLCFVNAFNAGC